MRRMFITITPILIMIASVFLITGSHPRKSKYDYYYYNVYMTNGATLKVLSCDPMINGVYVNEGGKLMHLQQSEVRGWEFVGKSKVQPN